jgi:hypothetical protein
MEIDGYELGYESSAQYQTDDNGDRLAEFTFRYNGLAA